MSNLRKYYYDNKSKIWKTILIIVSIFAVIYGVNYLMKIRSENYNTLAQNIPQQNTVVDNTSLTTNESVVGGVTLDENLKKHMNYYQHHAKKMYLIVLINLKHHIVTKFSILQKHTQQKIGQETYIE